jgi:hypothetical protein
VCISSACTDETAKCPVWSDNPCEKKLDGYKLVPVCVGTGVDKKPSTLGFLNEYGYCSVDKGSTAVGVKYFCP